MEKDKNPEILPPASLDCDGCEDKVKVNPNNSIYYSYDKQPWFNNIQICCAGCATISLRWSHQMHPTVKENIGSYAMLAKSDFCDDEDIINYYGQTHDVVEAPQYDLTLRQERTVSYLAYLLKTTPDEQIMAELSEPMPERTTSWRWDS